MIRDDHALCAQFVFVPEILGMIARFDMLEFVDPDLRLIA